MAITYDAVNNIITVVGETGSGDTEANAYNFEDVYQADVSGGWGVVSKQGDVQFLFDARIVIGDGSTVTWFVDVGKQIVFTQNAFTANMQNAISLRRYAYVRFGTLLDATTKSTKAGVAFVINNPNYRPTVLLDTYSQDWNKHDRQLFVYSSSFTNVGDNINRIFGRFRHGDTRIWHVQITEGSGPVLYSYTTSTMNIYDLVISSGTAIFQAYGSEGLTVDRVWSTDQQGGVWTQGATTFTLKNVFSIRNTRALFENTGSNPWTGTAYLVNFDVDSWTMNFAVSGATGKVYRQYEFDLRVSDKDDNPISGATITLKDKDGTQVFQVTTDANGEIVTQTVSRGWYEQATGDTLNDLSPHTLKIEKAGYQTCEKKFTLKEKTTWEIKLAKAVGVFVDFGRPVINLKKSEPENKNVMVL